MDIHQLTTFVAVARAGSITRAAEVLHLSQPAVSAHIKAMEDTLGLALFDRTPRGMYLTGDGQRLLTKAEETLAAHSALLSEATRLKGGPSGTLRLGAGSNANPTLVGKLLLILAERCPDVAVVLRHGTSHEVIAGIRDGSLDAGFFNDPGESDPALASIEVSRFGIWLVAPPGLVAVSSPLDWRTLADHPWIYPTGSACCGRTAESLFQAQHIRPKRIISVDREDMTRTLIAGGIGVGLLHDETAQEARARGEVDLLMHAQTMVRVLFAYRASRAQDPVLVAAAAIIRAQSGS